MADSLALSFRKTFEKIEQDGLFRGWEIRDLTVESHFQRTGERREPYVDTILRYMRKYCHSRYILVSKKESLYKKIF